MLTTKVERSLEDKQLCLAPHGTIARMKQDFSYTRLDGTVVTLCQGLVLVVDTEKSVGVFMDDHFEIFYGDYEIVYLN